MTVADLRRKPWWYYAVPSSWFMAEGDRDRDRDPRDRRDMTLDDTWSYRRRLEDQPPPPSPKVQVPFGVIVTITIYLVGQLVGGVWWAATLQSNLQHEMTDRAKEEHRLWESIQIYRAEVQALRVEMARAGSPARKQTTNRIDEEE